jgi:hypothetical protein
VLLGVRLRLGRIPRELQHSARPLETRCVRGWHRRPSSDGAREWERRHKEIGAPENRIGIRVGIRPDAPGPRSQTRYLDRCSPLPLHSLARHAESQGTTGPMMSDEAVAGLAPSRPHPGQRGLSLSNGLGILLARAIWWQG